MDAQVMSESYSVSDVDALFRLNTLDLKMESFVL